MAHDYELFEGFPDLADFIRKMVTYLPNAHINHGRVRQVQFSVGEQTRDMVRRVVLEGGIRPNETYATMPRYVGTDQLAFEYDETSHAQMMAYLPPPIRDFYTAVAMWKTIKEKEDPKADLSYVEYTVAQRCVENALANVTLSNSEAVTVFHECVRHVRTSLQMALLTANLNKLGLADVATALTLSTGVPAIVAFVAYGRASLPEHVRPVLYQAPDGEVIELRKCRDWYSGFHGEGSTEKFFFTPEQGHFVQIDIGKGLKPQARREALTVEINAAKQAYAANVNYRPVRVTRNGSIRIPLHFETLLDACTKMG